MNENTIRPATEDNLVHDHAPYRGPRADGRCHVRTVDGRLRGECMEPSDSPDEAEPATLAETVKAAIVNVAEKANAYGQNGLPETCFAMRVALVEIARAVDPDISWVPAYQRPREFEDVAAQDPLEELRARLRD